MLVTTNSDLVKGGIIKRRRRNPQSFMGQLASIKHWFIESAKRAKSPGLSPNLLKTSSASRQSSASNQGSNQQQKPTSANGNGNALLTPTSAHMMAPPTTTKRVSSLNQTQIRPISTVSQHHHRDSLSPSPMTPRSSSYRRTSAGHGLRGRKSTSSSVSSIRSIHHRHSHSKASSTSSRNSVDTTATPTNKSAAKSPHPSIKVLPTTPANSTSIPSNIRLVRGPPSDITNLKPSPMPAEGKLSAPHSPTGGGGGGLVYARRRKSPFRGPLGINTNLSSFNVGTGQGTPGLRGRHDSGNPFNNSNDNHNDTSNERGRGRRGSRRKLPAFTEELEEEPEEEEGEESGNENEDEDDEVEEVDVFSPVVLKRGESIHTITLLEDSGKPSQHYSLGENGDHDQQHQQEQQPTMVLDVDSRGEIEGRRSVSVDARGRVSVVEEEVAK